MFLELQISDWDKHKYVETFDLKHDFDNCERIVFSEVSHEEFVEKYEKLYKPVVITGATNSWIANYKWTIDVSLFCKFSSTNFDFNFVPEIGKKVP